MKKMLPVILSSLALIIVLIVVIYIFLINPTTKPTASSSSSPSTAPSSQSTDSSASHAAGTSQTTVIDADDRSADHESFTVKKGSAISVMFKIEEQNVSHGGLGFKGGNPLLDTGLLDPGESKTLNFTADQPFTFQPYWPSGPDNNYQISVQVD